MNSKPSSDDDRPAESMQQADAKEQDREYDT
jgi:hypothetical protein